jgi:predicted secreted protein
MNVRPQTKEEEDQELEELFESVVDEIEERQEYLEAIQKAGGNKEVETRTKNEIVERIGELQKIKELQQRTVGIRTNKNMRS